MGFRDEVDRHLASGDTTAAVRVLADGLDQLWSDRARGERLQHLAEQGFREGLQEGVQQQP